MCFSVKSWPGSYQHTSTPYLASAAECRWPFQRHFDPPWTVAGCSSWRTVRKYCVAVFVIRGTFCRGYSTSIRSLSDLLHANFHLLFATRGCDSRRYLPSSYALLPSHSAIDILTWRCVENVMVCIEISSNFDIQFRDLHLSITGM